MGRRSGWTLLLALVVAGAFYLGRSSESPSVRRGAASRATLGAERSAMPCRENLGWRVGDVDPRGMRDRDEVLAAARRAAELWARVAGRPLFRHDPDDGLPIHVAYNQELVELYARERALDSTQAALADSAASLSFDARRLQRRERSLSRRIERHNERARSVNEGAEAPDTLRRQLDRAERALGRERADLEELRASLDRRVRSLERAREDLRRAIEEYNRSPGLRLPVHVGDYAENVRTRGDRVLSVIDRSITVQSLADPTALAYVIAHEMGHALGLGHVPDTVAVMAEIRTARRDRAQLAARPADRRELRRRCPDLVADR